MSQRFLSGGSATFFKSHSTKWIILIVFGLLLNLLNITVTGETIDTEWGYIEIHPDISRELTIQEHTVNFTWKKSNTEVDLAFVFDEKLSNANVWRWENKSRQVWVDDYGWVERTYTLLDISNYQTIDEPSSVDFGDIPSNTYATGHATIDDQFPQEGDWTIGFDSFEWIIQGQSAVFTYTVWGLSGGHYETVWDMDWVSKKHLFDYHHISLGHAYVIDNVPLIQNVEQKFKYQYHTKPNTDGKWDLYVKKSSDVGWTAGNIKLHVDPWWDSDWGYSKNLTVADKRAEFQMNLTVWKADGHDDAANAQIDTEGRCADDFGDIRFVYNNNTPVCYWMRNKTDGVCAYFYINLSTSNYSYMEMYYGATGKTTLSNGTHTMRHIFEDFDQATINTSLWQGANIGEVSLSGSIATHTRNTDSTTRIDTKKSYASPSSVVTRCKFGNDVDNTYIGTGLMINSAVEYGVVDTYGDGVHYVSVQDGGWQHIAAGVDLTADYVFYENRWVAGTSMIHYLNDADKGKHTANVPASNPNKVGWYINPTTGGTSYMYCDWIAMKMYCTGEMPSWSKIGNEQSPPNNAPTITVVSSIDGNTSCTIPVYFEVTVADADSDTMTITFFSNHTGLICALVEGFDGVLDGTYSTYCFNFSKDANEYMWYANVSDGSDSAWTNQQNITTTTLHAGSSSSSGGGGASVGGVRGLAISGIGIGGLALCLAIMKRRKPK